MKQRARLVIVNQDAGYLFVDLANAALGQYDEVCLLCGTVVELGSRLDERVLVRRIVRYKRDSLFTRFLSWIAGFMNIVWVLRTRFREHEVIASSNPPLNTLLPLLIRNKIGLYVLDLYPEALDKTGMVSERNVIVSVWARLNRLAYPRFQKVWSLTPSMRIAIEGSYNIAVDLMPAWSTEMDECEDETLLDRERIRDAWVVLYSGNLGREHEVERLLGSAARLVHCKGLLFVIAGEGWKKAMIRDRVANEKLGNVRLLGKMSAPEFSTLLRHAKIGVVTQSFRTADVCIPSKTFNLLASGLPILGIGKPDSDFGELISSSKSGKVFHPDEEGEMSEFLEACWRNEPFRLELRNEALEIAGAFTKKNAESLVESFKAAKAGV